MTPFQILSFRIIIPLVLGVLIQEHYGLPIFPVMIMLGFVLLAMCALGFLSITREWLGIRSLFLYILIFLLGYSLAFFHDFLTKSLMSWKDRLPLKATVVGSIQEINSHDNQLILNMVQMDSLPMEGRFVINRMSLNSYQIGDTLIVNGYFQPFLPPNNPYEFDYQAYQHLRHTYGKMYQPKVIAHLPYRTFHLLTELKRYRNKMVQDIWIKQGLEADKSVAIALLLGEKGYIDKATKNSYINTGSMHVLAVSGMHVGIIAMIVGSILGLFFRHRKFLWLKSSLMLVLIWGYACITGLSPSTLRAAVMFSFLSLSWLRFEKKAFYHSVFLSAIVLILFNPSIIYDVGFQLSYTAILGIMFFTPIIKNIFFFSNKWVEKTWDVTCVAIAATIGTLPLSLYYFQYFSSVFMISNLVTIVTSTIILAIGVFYILSYMLPFGISSFFAKMLLVAVHWQNQLLDYLGNLSWAIMDGVFVDFWQMIVLIGLIITLGFYLKTHQSAWIYTSMCLTIVIAVMGSVRYFSDKKHQIVFFSNYTSTAFSLVSEKQAVLITDKNYNSNEYFQNIVDKYHRLEGLKVEKVVLDTINQQLIFKGDTIVIAHRTSKNALLPKGNILLLRNNAFIPKDKSYEHIILDATNDNQHIRKVKKYRKDVFNVKNDKAYTHVIRRN